MAISQKEVEHIAHLSRIALTEAGKEKFADELSAVLSFVEKLNETDTADALPLTGGTELVNISRADEQVNKNLEGKQAALVAAASKKQNGWIKVKSVFG